MSSRSKGEDPPRQTPAGPKPANGVQVERASPLAALDAFFADFSTSRRAVPAVCILLAAMVCLVFGQTLRYGFVNYDDDVNVYENPIVIKGLTFRGVTWAFTHVQAGHWDPLTTISHLLDCQLFGLRAGGHHLGNVLLHGTASILLFLVLRQMTKALWRSAFVAAVFAVHPLHVESVAWVSERKDVLSGVFFMLTIAAYVHYTRKPQSLPRYLAALVLFALGLMSKSMLVTLPFIFLLLDYWPLDRLAHPAQASAGAAPRAPDRLLIPRRLILEKAPFFALSAAMCVIQVVVNQEGIVSTKAFPLLASIANTPVSCAAYIGEMICPADLAVIYPLPANQLPLWEVLPAICLLVSISAGAFFWRSKYPFLLVGWLWYLVMLAPVIGLVQAGLQAHADRYTYLPQIGLYIAVTWLAAEGCVRLRYRHVVPWGGAAAVLSVLLIAATHQTSYWRDSETLWTHTLACTQDNYIAHNNLGNSLFQQGRKEDAFAQFSEALRINPVYADAHYNLADALFQKGDVEEAIVHYEASLKINPNFVEAHYSLGTVLLQNGRVDEAIGHFQKAIQINPGSADSHYNFADALLQKGEIRDAIVQYQQATEIRPDYAEAHYSLGTVLLQNGRVEEAITHLQRALDIKADYPEAHNNLGTAFLKLGKVEEGISHYRKALEIKPDYIKVQNSLAYVLATCPQDSLRDGMQAVALAQQANQATGGGNPMVLRTLAAAYAETGQFPLAVETAQRALELANSPSNAALADQLRSQIVLYNARTPLRDKSLGK